MYSAVFYHTNVKFLLASSCTFYPAVACSIPTPVHGNVSKQLGTTFGSTAHVRCNTGYTKIGSSFQLTCNKVSQQGTGLWTGNQCERKNHV